MTTLVPFNPNPTGSPPFRAVLTLDGSSVLATAYWNIFAQRWYLTLTNQSGTVLWTGGLVGSPDEYDIPLAPDVFKVSTVLYRAGSGNLEISP